MYTDKNRRSGNYDNNIIKKITQPAKEENNTYKISSVVK